MSRDRPHHAGPSADAAARSALDGALAALAEARTFALDWPSSELHLMASLAAAVADRLPEAVDRCRQEGHSWAEIGDLLGVTKQSAVARFGPLTRQGEMGPSLPWRGRPRVADRAPDPPMGGLSVECAGILMVNFARSYDHGRWSADEAATDQPKVRFSLVA